MQADDNGKYIPIQFASRALTSVEAKRPNWENELLAAVFGITAFHYWIAMKQFTLLTDNTAVKHLLVNKTKQNTKIMRWQVFLSQYTFETQYKYQR